MSNNYNRFMLQPGESYKPKSSHPWRRYATRHDGNGVVVAPLPESKLRVFLVEMVESWDTYTVDSSNLDLGDLKSFKHMTDERIAGWLAEFLRRNFMHTPIDSLADPLLDQ